LRIEAFLAPGGEILHVLGAPASALPRVAKRDLEQAWEHAGASPVAAPPRQFRMPTRNGAPVDLVLRDPDAAAWAAAIERSIGLSTAHGVSVCLRLLALVALMAQSAWARDWFELRRDGARIRPELLHAAALAPLTEEGGFDEAALGALLPERAARDARI
jgi:hypothetical protein